jgi:hypothetical protein
VCLFLGRKTTAGKEEEGLLRTRATTEADYDDKKL